MTAPHLELSIGPIASALRKTFLDVVRGKSPKYRAWCEPVYASAMAPRNETTGEHIAAAS